jgi:hypothetical protein
MEFGQLAVAADGSQPDRIVGLEVGEPVVQQVVERRLCRPTPDARVACLAWMVGATLSPWRPSAWWSAARAAALVG